MLASHSALRDITIKYKNIELNTQVPLSLTVGSYFTKGFQEHSQFFAKQTQQRHLSCTPLSKLKNYDVRLNSQKAQSSVKNAQLQFGTYNPSKRLTFHIIEEQIEQPEQEQSKDQFIEFQLISGGSIQKSQALNIKGKNYQEVDTIIRQTFAIEIDQQLQLINLKNNSTIGLDRQEQPYKQFVALRLNTVGVKRVYFAG